LGSFQEIYRKRDFITLDLFFDHFQYFLHIQPKVYFLTCCSTGGVSIKLGELGHLLNFLDPAVDLGLKFVEECGFEICGIYCVDCDGGSLGFALIMVWKMRLKNCQYRTSK